MKIFKWVKTASWMTFAALACLLFSHEAAFAQACSYELALGGKGMRMCKRDNSITLEIAGQKLATFQHRDMSTKPQGNPPYWHLQIENDDPNLSRYGLGPVRDLRMIFQVNSGGPYANQLILELCKWDPNYIRIDWDHQQLGRRECGSWVTLMPFPYFRP